MKGPTLGQALYGFELYRKTLLAVYCGFCALGTWTILSGVREAEGGRSLGFAVLSLGLCFGSLVAASYRLPAKPWTWNACLILICLGVPLCATTPFSLLMLWVWLGPEVKAHFEAFGAAAEAESGSS